MTEALRRVPKLGEIDRACVEIAIAWGGTTLHVAHLSPPRPFWLGAGEAGLPCDYVVPEEALPATRLEVVTVNEHGDLSVVDASGASMTLEAGDERTVAFGDLTVRVVRGFAAAKAPRKPFLARRTLGIFAAVAAAHALLLVGSAKSAATRASDDDYGVTAEDQHYITQMIAKADEKEMAEDAAEQGIAMNEADNKEGGTGTRGKGEEGSMGDPSFSARGNRYGVQGPSDNPDPHIARQAALRDAADFGMIGMLNSGAGGDPNAPTAPWGRDDSLGAGGLGLTGVGEGGGGRGAGLGTLQGIGSGAKPGAHQYAAPIAKSPAPAQPKAESAPLVAPVLPLVKLDPNGRFATTYRPGAGHLAAFESALARGIVPAADSEVVSDIGARYAPDLAPPSTAAIGMKVDLERGELGPNGGTVHLRVALRSNEKAAARPHLSVHLVLDISGSMEGESITRAREAASALVDKLDAADDFSLVTFSSDAQVVVKDGVIGTRRAAVKTAISQIKADGGTNIGAGLALGYAEAEAPAVPSDAVKVVFLVSDGRANIGVTQTAALSKLALDAFQKGIQTSSFGLGQDYDGALMSSIASDGAGGYYYLKTADQIAPALATEINKRLDPVATAVELRVRLKSDVDLLRVYGSRRLTDTESKTVRAIEVAADKQAEKRDHIAADRQDDAEGGMRFFFPAFARDDTHVVLIQLGLPAGVSERDVATVELKYKDRLAAKNDATEARVKIGYAASDAASVATVNKSVERTVVGFSAGEALIQASTLIAHGDRANAAAVLVEREGILKEAAERLAEPLFLRDAARMARLRGDTETTSGSGDPLVLAMLLETAGRVHLR